MKNKSLSLEEHLSNADDLAMVCHHLLRIFNRCNQHYFKSSPLMKLLDKLNPHMWTGYFVKLKSELDTEYQKVVSDKAFKEHGHIYYHLDERFERLRGKHGGHAISGTFGE